MASDIDYVSRDVAPWHVFHFDPRRGETVLRKQELKQELLWGEQGSGHRAGAQRR